MDNFSDDIGMYEFIQELQDEIKQLKQELMFVEAERDKALQQVENIYYGGPC